MKIKFLTIFAGLALGAALSVSAQSITIKFDEVGNAYTITPAGGSTPVPFTQTTDSGPGGLPGALTYTLPSGLTPLVGDVRLTEPPSTSQFSDVVRFNPNGVIVVYSDVSPNDPRDAKADIGLPTAFYANALTIPENGPNGAPYTEAGPNGLFGYTPTSGQPGFVPGLNVTYNFFSDKVTVTGNPPPIIGLNKDVINTTGTTVNNIEWLIQGSFTSVNFHYDGVFPNFTITPQGSNTLLTWSGASIAPGGMTHVGFSLPSNGLTVLGFFWTFNNTVVGCVHQVPIGQAGSHIINGQPGQIAFDNIAQNCESVPLTVGNVRLEWFADEVPLALLNPTSQRNPIRVDTLPGSPVTISPGGEAIVQFQQPPPAGANFVMVQYSVNNDPSLPAATNTTDFIELQVGTGEQPVPVFGTTGLTLLILLVAGSGIYFIRTKAGKIARSTG